MMRIARLVAAIAAVLVFEACASPGQKARDMMDPKRYFEGAQLRLAEAIDKDSEQAIAQAIAAGAKMDEAGQEGVTPLMYSLVAKKKNAMAALLARRANPNKRANNGQTATILATKLPDLDYLRLILKHGGDPNTLEPDNDPILIFFIAEANNDGIRLLASAGANLNILDRTGNPAVISAALSDHWDCVWTLIELGADWRGANRGITLPWLAYSSNLHADSPIYPWLRKTTDFLKAKGVHFPPPSPREVLSKQQAQP